MNLTVVVNDVARVTPDQSTTALAWRAAAAGGAVTWTDVRNLLVAPDGSVQARCWPAPADAGPDAASWLARGQAAPPVVHALGPGTMVLVRTNPGRDAARGALHDTTLAILALARDQGAVVLNDPDGLRRAGSKLYLARFPAWTRPDSFFSADPQQLAAWVRQRSQPSVLKPLAGTQGTDVFRVRPDDLGNLRQICDVVTRNGHGIAQGYVEEAPDGDVRLILVDGKLLEVDGHAAAVRRVPGAGEFRSNVAQGGHAAPAQVRPAWRRIVDAVGPLLAADGLFLVGLDLVGNSVVEANVYSPGGFVDAEAFAGGADFTGAVLAALQAHEGDR